MYERDEDSEGSADVYLASTADLVSAYVSNNSIRASDLSALIETVYGTLRDLSKGKVELKPEEPQTPAVPIKKSITPDYLICLEDGKKFRSLKRHIGTVFGLTPEQYRAKWGLPRDYPMVAPAYSAVRSQLAKDIGLGRQPAPATEAVEVAAKKPAKRERKAKGA